MPSRRRSRERALQMIYQWEVGGGTAERVVRDYFGKLAGSSPVDVDPFAETLFNSVVDDAQALDDVIQRHAREWSLDRISIVVRQLLRLAIAELRAGETPASVVIDEALEVGKRFAGSESTAFVNGILDAARRECQRAA